MKKADFEKLSSKDPKVKYGFTKELLKLGTENPNTLYYYFNQFENMLKSENNIFKWTAIDLIGYLSSVDKDSKIDRNISELLKFLHGGNLITCNHAIFALGLIAQNKLKHRKRIIKELISISKVRFETDECKNIAIGKVIETLNKFLEVIKNDKSVIQFVKNAVSNKRNSTKKKAVNLTKKLNKIKNTDIC